LLAPATQEKDTDCGDPGYRAPPGSNRSIGKWNDDGRHPAARVRDGPFKEMDP